MVTKRKYIRYKKNHVTLNHEYSKHTLINLLYPLGFKLLYNDCGEFNINKAMGLDEIEKCYRVDVVLTNKVTKRLLLIEIDGEYHKHGRSIKKTERKRNFIMDHLSDIFKNKFKDYDIQYYNLDPKDLYGKDKKQDSWILSQFEK